MSVDLRGWEIFEVTNLPIIGASITIKTAGVAQPNPAAVVTTTTTSANGEWAVTGLADGYYDVEVTYLGATKTYKGLSKVSHTQVPANFGSQAAAAVFAAPAAGGYPTFQTLAAAHIASALGSWAAFTPSIAQPGALTHTVTQARQLVRAKVCSAQIHLSLTGAGTAANAVGVGLGTVPANVATGAPLGHGYIYDSSTGTYYAGSWVFSGTGANANFVSDGSLTLWGISPSIALANLDLLSGQFNYEVA